MKIKTAVPDGLERKSYGTAVFMFFGGWVAVRFIRSLRNTPASAELPFRTAGRQQSGWEWT